MTKLPILSEQRDLISDPFSLFSRVATTLKTAWLATAYRFPHLGRNISIHYSVDVSRQASMHITLGNDVYIGQDVWLNIVETKESRGVKINFENGCRIGRRAVISARNNITLEDNVLLAPAVLIMDHNHQYSDVNFPILEQGVTEGGTITIGRNCWLGYGCVISCGMGLLKIGRNSVIGAHAVVTKSIPAFTVVAGNPARIIKQYDFDRRVWVRVGECAAFAEQA
jgi:carbonic anhydrase/acetyltransferase-like protein (isoleucine patch superfamily)